MKKNVIMILCIFVFNGLNKENKTMLQNFSKQGKVSCQFSILSSLFNQTFWC